MQTEIAVTVARTCTRCRLDLTDPASVQHGLGPICREFSNAVLAKELPTAWDAEAQGGLFLLSAESFESEGDRARFEAVYLKIMTSKGANSAEPVTGEDARKLVRELAYLASAAPSRPVYEILINAIRGLGYPTYAAAVSGASSSSEASLTVEGGRIWLSGARNAAGRAALARIGGWWDRRSERYHAPLSAAEAFVKLARIYWPLVTGAEAVLEAAKVATAPKLTPAPAPAPVVVLPTPKPEAPAPAVPEVRLEPLGGEVLVFTPFHPKFNSHLKSTCSWRWDRARKAWAVKRSDEAQARKLLALYFPAAVVEAQGAASSCV
jgi:hypothetical protein